jgi:ATP-dependent helicase/nuclease subunit A
MSSTPIEHEMLIANAGSGKTFRLTVRTITLLALGVPPGKIAALTFTRKAAGEFLAAVFQRVARAASDPAALLALRNDTGVATLDTVLCHSILLQLTTQIHRLSMGTIDSLFGRIARSFPLETGLAGDFSVLHATARSIALRETLATLFREQGGEAFQDFLDLVRQQSRKQSERQVFDTLLAAIDTLHEKYLATPSYLTWGERAAIWPTGNTILRSGDLTSAADNLWQAILSTHPNLDTTAHDAWKSTLQAVRETVAANHWTAEVDAFVKKKISIAKDGREYLPTGRSEKARVYLFPLVAEARENLLLALRKPRLEELLRRSRALYDLLAAFEVAYDRQVRLLGRLTFSDITSVLARQVDRPEWQAGVGYRLDQRFDHWLLDEFQDTSRLQWKVLGALVDEVLQDDSGARSFFYVGDTKQAIYSWRGGDPRLFFEIADYYNQSGTQRIVRAAPLDVSYRSDRAIIETINGVFGQLSAVAEPLKLPQETVADWSQAWVEHRVLPTAADGYFCWQTVDKNGDEDENEGGAVDLAIARILDETRPWERGWTCAALKRSNQSAEALAALLQTRGIPVAVEGKANPCIDNPLGVALLAACKLAASPGDLLSRSLLQSHPYAPVFLSDDDFVFREKTLARIAATGFAGAVEAWLDAMDLTTEPFLASRARDFLSAANRFDASRQLGDDLGSFVHFIENYQRQESEGTGVVRIMTIHQAKGLTLDMTIVSGLDSPFCEDKTTGALALEKDWGLLMPGSDLARHDAVLASAKLNLLAISTYGEICAAYVAMTRPRHALYVLTKKIKENSESKNLARLLALTLGYPETSLEKGDPAWYLARSVESPLAASPENPLAPTLPRPLQGTPRAVGPSSTIASVRSAKAARLGTEIHSALAQIEWFPTPPTTPPRLENFLASPEARALFTRPTQPHWLWRERSFECLLDGQWIAGTFDRVHILLDENATPLSAEIIDFKHGQTDAATLQKRHAAQLQTYRCAAALLLGLKLEKITARIVSIGQLF